MLLLFIAQFFLALLQAHGLPARLLCPWEFLGKITGVDSHFLLQRSFLTQGSDLHLLPALPAESLLLSYYYLSFFFFWLNISRSVPKVKTLFLKKTFFLPHVDSTPRKQSLQSPKQFISISYFYKQQRILLIF